MTEEKNDSIGPERDQMSGPTEERRRNFMNPRKKARRYQLEVMDRALDENTIIFLETGCGKTLIAVLLIDALSHQIRKPSIKICVFLAPNKALVDQQAKEIELHTDLQVGKYWGSMEGDTWNYTWWREQVLKYEVIVMTPQILFNNLHHCFFTMGMIELLIFDECHHAQKKHPYANIMREFYHNQRMYRPKIFGMTASPIIGKVDGGGLQQIGNQMNKLESMLDAKVYTLKDRLELEALLPNPLEQIRLYEPSYSSDSVKRQNGLLQSLRTKFLRASEESDNTKDVLMKKKQMEEVATAYRSLEYCIHELGSWCAQKAAELLIEKDVYFEAGWANPKQAFLQEALSIFKLINVKEGKDDHSPSGSTILSAKLLSSKLLCLLRILLDFRENFQKCIIFVDRVVATRVLSCLFSFLPCLSFLRCLPLVGSQSMSQKSQQKTIEKFRSGEANLLVATDIAEEGLDIQSCFMVIRFDAPKTNRSFIQSRGRARQLGSNYFVLVERGNLDQLNNVIQLRDKENLMWELSANRRDMPVLLQEPETFEVEDYKVESTGAIVTTDYSVPLLYRYCSKLPGDQFYRPAPEFSFTKDVGGIFCEVRLPSTAPVQLVKGHVCSTSKMARRVAALECCKKLHELGVLTDYLLPASEIEGGAVDESDDPTTLSLRADCMVELHSTLIPSTLQGQWEDGCSKVRLFGYDLQIVAEPQDREYATYALFLEASFDNYIISTTTELHLTKGRVAKVQLVPGGEVEFDVCQLRDAQSFQERIIRIMLDRNTEQKAPTPLASPQAHWDPRRLYLFLPVVPNRSTSIAVDWTSIHEVLSNVPGNIPAEIPDVDMHKHIETKPEAWDCKSPAKSCGVFQMADGPVPVEKVVNSLVETVYNGSLYCVVDVLWDMTGTSQFECNPSQYLSYIDYFKKRYKLDLVHRRQPLLKAKPLMRMHNLIVKRPDKEPGSASKAEMLVELPPEFCSVKVLGFPTRTVNTLSLVPSFMHRLEYMLIASQLREMLKDAFNGASKVSPKTVLQALTTATCLETFSLERLELFGDSFLKFAVSKQLFLVNEHKHEGQLTKMRQRVICNAFLHKLGTAKNFPLYIHDEHFQPRDWAAPGRPCRLICDERNYAAIHALHDATDASKTNMIKCSERHRWVQKKTVADVVEALIGAHLVDGGPDAALAFMDWMGIEVNFDPELIAQASARCAGDVRFIHGIDLRKLEEVLGYTFQNKAVLVEALTHSSYQIPFGNCYQRLEFLGDAVLDFLITSHLYATSPDLDPGFLTDLRSATASNECFARVAVRNDLQNYLLHNSPYLEEQVRKFVIFIDNVSQGREPFYGWECDKGPKVLGDLVESLAGAVLVDTGFSSEKVWEVFEPLLQPIVTPDTLHLHPVRELVELCNREKFQLDYESTTRGKLRVVTYKVIAENIEVKREASKGDKKSAKRLAAYETLESLKSLGWEHPYRKLAKTLVSQGRIGARKTAKEASSNPKNVRDIGQRNNHDVQSAQVQDHGYNSQVANVRNLPLETPVEDLQRVAEGSTQSCSNIKEDVCENMIHGYDTIELDLDFSSPYPAVDIYGDLITNDSPGHRTDKDVDEVLRGSCPSSRSSSGLGSHIDDACEVSIMRFSDASSHMPIDNEKKGRMEDDAMEELSIRSMGIGSDNEEDIGFQLDEKDFSASSVPSSLHTSNDPDEFLAEVLRLTEGDSEVDWFGDPRTRNHEDLPPLIEIITEAEKVSFPEKCQNPIAEDDKKVPILDQASFKFPLSSKPKVDDEISIPGSWSAEPFNHTQNGIGSYIDNSQPVDAKDCIFHHAFDDVKQTPREALIYQFVQQLENSSEFTARPPREDRQEPIYPGAVDFREFLELPVNSKEPPSSVSSGLVAPELLLRGKVIDENVGRAREELHNICAKNKWEMPVYTERDRQGPPHAPRFTYMVTVKFTLGTSEYEIECEGEPMRATKRAMDSAATQAIAWLQQEVLGR